MGLVVLEPYIYLFHVVAIQEFPLDNLVYISIEERSSRFRLVGISSKAYFSS